MRSVDGGMLCKLSVITGLLMIAGPARADEPTPVAAPSEKPHREAHYSHFGDTALYVPVGVGFSSIEHLNTKQSGVTLAAEASAVVFPVGDTASWVGGYVDTAMDFAIKRARASAGVEVGFLFIGFDGGVFTQIGDEPARWGFRFRPMLSLAFAHLYGSWGWVANPGVDDRFREIGVLVKYPFPTKLIKPSEPDHTP